MYEYCTLYQYIYGVYTCTYGFIRLYIIRNILYLYCFCPLHSVYCIYSYYYTMMMMATRRTRCGDVSLSLALALALAFVASLLTRIGAVQSSDQTLSGAEAVSIRRVGSVDLGILAETTPVVWNETLWLLECIQGEKYYGNQQGESYLRFTNPLTGVRSPHFAIGYGLGNAVVDVGMDQETDTMFVFATKTPYGISTNNTEVSVFWSTDILSGSWDTAIAMRADDNGVIPQGCEGRKKTLWNTSVQKGKVNGKMTFLMAYEYNCGGPGWQTHFALATGDGSQCLATAKWEPIPYENQKQFLNISHANPTIRYNADDGYWYLVSTRGANGILVADIYRSQTPTNFASWEAPTGWSVDNPLAAPLLAPSAKDQVPAPLPWHPDTKAVVTGNSTAMKKAKNINTSDLDLCTAKIDGKVRTIMYWAWGDQGLGPTAMVLCLGIADTPMEDFLSSYFAS